MTSYSAMAFAFDASLSTRISLAMRWSDSTSWTRLLLTIFTARSICARPPRDPPFLFEPLNPNRQTFDSCASADDASGGVLLYLCVVLDGV